MVRGVVGISQQLSGLLRPMSAGWIHCYREPSARLLSGHFLADVRASSVFLFDAATLREREEEREERVDSAIMITGGAARF